jgi:hypothetical protein
MKSKVAGSEPKSMGVVLCQENQRKTMMIQEEEASRSVGGIAKVLRSLTLGAYLALNARHPIINVSMSQ